MLKCQIGILLALLTCCAHSEQLYRNFLQYGSEENVSEILKAMKQAKLGAGVVKDTPMIGVLT